MTALHIDGARQRRISTNGVELDTWDAGPEDGPLIVLAHGFPESSWSWRHQIPALAGAGYRVLAPDQRGYARSSKPTNVTDYGTRPLTDDLLGLVDDVGRSTATFVGHDWGALVCWDLARLHPDRVNAVCCVSVPFVDWPVAPTTLFRSIYGEDTFFYMLYFQEVGPAEREMEADVEATMRGVLWGGSGPGYAPDRPPRPAVGTGFLDAFGGGEAGDVSAWCTEHDVAVYVDQFSASGFFGPVSWYRNLDANYALLQDYPPSRATMPVSFIGGSKDGVIAARLDTIDAAHAKLSGYRGHVLIDGAGHWTQQEAPNETNEALLHFLKGQ